ncbi:MAG TPA: hypothetical protein VKA87_03415 [Nitrososphaeraceae archaeon]|nr:hypothetical protein [Nitrososphaeraceae archaeon]
MFTFGVIIVLHSALLDYNYSEFQVQAQMQQQQQLLNHLHHHIQMMQTMAMVTIENNIIFCGRTTVSSCIIYEAPEIL